MALTLRLTLALTLRLTLAFALTLRLTFALRLTEVRVLPLTMRSARASPASATNRAPPASALTRLRVFQSLRFMLRSPFLYLAAGCCCCAFTGTCVIRTAPLPGV